MARQGWGVSIVTAIGIAAGAGAAQLGFGYGLGVIAWTPTEAGATDTAWADGLAWATWLAASSTVLGAVCAQRLHHRSAPKPAEPDSSDSAPTATTEADMPPSAPDSTGPETAQVPLPVERGGLLHRVALALGAGIGGLVTVLLIAVPARVATGADTGTPQRTAAVQATLGILLGVVVAIWALRSRAAAVNVTATAAWLWLLAVVSVIDGVRVGRGLTGAQLGTWQLDPDHSHYWIGGQLYWPGALLALVPALLIGVLAARRAARSTGHRVDAAASGAAGPVLVALAYLTTLPHWSTLGPAQLSTQLVAPYAVIAGVAGSVLAALLAERADRNRTTQLGSTAPATAADSTATVASKPTTPATIGGPNPTPATAETDPEPPVSGKSNGTPGRRRRAGAAGAGPAPDEDALPRVPAPRTDPDPTGPADEDPTPTIRRPTRATRRPTHPTTD
ncbi:hypothetical protein GCM10028790_39320 [Micromonospora taraxaci]|uniref:Uncharacterized protein n=1 Tax=Micromonospora taraxaci TaxID=1316803 RepID=A0A561VTH7_9ACTN|nr:hypothetical protein [Micromonospora taraxaci]TWG14921.1 hypothetical protein FHU34_11223 [Micromonospora taraxaci]